MADAQQEGIFVPEASSNNENPMIEPDRGGGKRNSMMVPKDQLVFNNGFALDSMIQACSAATEEEKLINAVKRLAGFIKAHHTDTSEKQRDKISSMVEKQKAAKRESILPIR
jgi:hypothetical protein